MIHKRILVFLIAFLPVIISACSDDDDDDLIGKWYRVSDMDGLARNYASSFTIGNKGYLICGYDGNYLKDFYAFNPVANSWTQTISIGGTKRQGATSFVINGIAYVCCGQNNGEYVDDFWKFDPSTESWTQLRDISDSSDEDYDDDYTITRTNGVAFVIDGAAYLTCGENGSLRSDTWKYYPATDLWENVAKFKGTARTATASFSSGEKGFVVSGKSGTTQFDDIWELHPNEYDDDEY